MKNRILIFVTALIMIGTHAYAGNGDLIVDGNMGVGTTNPANKLHINGGITWGGESRPLVYSGEDSIGLFVEQVGQSSTTSRIRLQSSTNGDTTNYSQFFIDPLNGFSFVTLGAGNGNVGIGTTTPAAKLDVAGGILGRDINGNTVNLTSDARFKKNILPVESSLTKVLNLNGHSYEWKTDEYKEKGFPEGRHYGVIAQEIEKVLPEVVSTGTDGTKAVAYTEIIPVLIEAIKEQQKIIEQKQALIETLQNRIENHEREINDIKSQLTGLKK